MKSNTHSGRHRALLIGVAISLLAAVSPDRPRERTVAFTYQTVIKSIPAGAKTVAIWVPVPHDSPFQRITNLTITAPYPYAIDSLPYGNRAVQISLPGSTTAPFTLTMQFTALRKEHIQAQLYAQKPADPGPNDPDMARWLLPDRLVPIDGNVKRWAQELIDSVGAKTDLEKARAIYNHVIATVKYDKSGQGWGRGDIYYACDARRGNCTDFHAIFIGYCRAVRIPARFAIGFSLPTDRPAGQISGYHCWAEFFVNGIGWVPVDASEAAKNPARRAYFFGAHDENRVEFTIGRDLQLYPRQAEPLNYFIYPYAEIDSKPFTGLDNRFTYRNVGT